MPDPPLLGLGIFQQNFRLIRGGNALVGASPRFYPNIEADWLGVCFMNDSGYDPQDMVIVMQILELLSQGQRPPEFLSTHPDPGNRILQIQADIQNVDQCP